MTDDFIERRRRAARADPDDLDAALAHISARVRSEGAAAARSLLDSRPLWNHSPRELQDLAISAVAEGLIGLERAPDREAGAIRRLAVFRHPDLALDLLLLPGDVFAMGSEEGYRHERPLRFVTLRPFLLARSPLTQAQWDRSPGDDLRRQRGPQLPIERVSWWDALAWLEQTELRLCSEAEWEYAARAADFPSPEAWCAENSEGQTRPCDRAPANAFGLADMLGNVWEWCQDDWTEDHEEAPEDGRPRQVPYSQERVVRGGSWSSSARDVRPAFRLGLNPGTRLPDLGFRPALSLPD